MLLFLGLQRVRHDLTAELILGYMYAICVYVYYFIFVNKSLQVLDKGLRKNIKKAKRNGEIGKHK